MGNKRKTRQTGGAYSTKPYAWQLNSMLQIGTESTDFIELLTMERKQVAVAAAACKSPLRTSAYLSELYQRIALIHSSITPPIKEKDVNQIDHSQARFQRTDQWLPVYSWLESVDTEEVVKSKDILDWLSENPEVKNDLYSRHSRYHLMHYIKKCHVKILKRKERKKGLQITDKINTAVALKNVERKRPAPLSCSMLNNLPTDSDMYLAKRNEALRKYEILLELESQLSTLFPKPESVKFLKDS